MYLCRSWWVLLVLSCWVARAADLDPQFSALATQLFAAPDEAARTVILDAHPSLAAPPLVHAMSEIAGKSYDRHDYANALKMYQAVCAVATRVGDRWGTANCYYNMGLTELRLNQMDASIANLQRSLSLFESVGTHVDLSRTLNSVGLFYYHRGDNITAMSYLNRAMDEAEKSGNPVSVAQTNTNLSSVYKSLGKYSEGIQALQKALEVTRRDPKLERQTAIIMNNLGGLYHDQRDLELAVSYHSQALALKEKLQFNPVDLAGTVLNLGVDHQAADQYEKAEAYFKRALTLTTSDDGLSVRALTFYNYGDLLHTLGRNSEALAKIDASLEISRRLSDRQSIADAQIELAEIAFDEHRVQQALDLVRPALEYGRQQSDLRVLSRAQDVAGSAQMALGNLEDADMAFADGIRVIEFMRDQLPGERQMAVRFLNAQSSIFEHMVELQVRRQRPDLAFAWSERSKGRALFDALQTGRVDIAKSLTSDEREQESKLAGTVTRINEEILHESQADSPDHKRMTDLGSQLQTARNRYQSFLVTLYATHPTLKVQRVAFDPVTPAELVGSLPDRKTALLEYSLTDKGGYLFVITAKRDGSPLLNLYPIPGGRKGLERDVNRFREQIASRDLGYRTLARSLYRRLVAPAAGQLRGKSTLVIVPDSSLWALPFQTLESRAGRYLIQDHAVFYSPSLSVLYQIRKLHHAAESSRRRLLALDATDLPTSRREVEGLRQVYGAANVKILEGAEANEVRLKTEAPNYQVVHVAAHGVFEDRSPMNSYLVLAKAGKAEAGVLEARRMMDLNLRADLVVLSGCETGRGATGNEGLLGMSWALFIAGSPSTIASQWKVESNSTSELMLGFHRNVQHESKAAALQQAELAIMQNPAYRHPFYWSSFVLLGQGF